MARYKVQGPDGAVHVFEGPDGASQDQVIAFAQQHFGKPAAAPIDPKQFAADDPGVIMSTLIGAGWTFDRVMKGMQQLYHGALNDKQALADLKGRADEEKRLYEPLTHQHPVATAIGETLPAMAIPVGGTAALGTTAAKLALAGAIPGALEYGSAGERAGRAVAGGVGSVVGGVVVPKVITAAVKGVPAVGRAVRAAVEPLTENGRTMIAGRTLVNAAGDDAAAAAQRLAQAAEKVPGSVPTVAQAAENGGLAALERSVAGGNPAPFTERAKEQAAARLQALRGIAQDDAARAAALKARADVTDPLYSQAKGATYTMDDKLQRLLDTPAMQQAMARAKTLAENNQRPFTFQVQQSTGMGSLGNQAATTSKQITGQGLQDLKMAVDAMLKDPASGFAGAEGTALKSLRGQLLNWMEGSNPAFKQARTTYADMSKPIGQMDVGQQLLKDLEPSLNDFGQLAQETGSKYATAMRNADQTAVKATKFKGAGMRDLMTPDQMGSLEGIGQDLARKANAQKLGKEYGGSDTFQKLALSNIAERSGAPGVVGTALDLPGVSKVAKFLYRDPEEKIQTKIAQSLLDPKTAAQLMEEAIKGGKPRPIGNILLDNPSRAAQLTGALPAVATTDLFAR
jgi:hypothetical protein